MRLSIIALAWPPIALAGCGGGSITVNAADDKAASTPAAAPANVAAPAATRIAPAAPPGTVLGGVDLAKPVAGSGSEPFWGIDIAGDAIVYTDASVDDIQPEGLAPATRAVSDGSAVYSTTRSDGSPVVVTLTAAACVAPSGASTPLTVRIQIGGQTRTGCAGPAESQAR